MASVINNIDAHFSYLLPMAESIGMKCSQAVDESRKIATDTKTLVDWLKAPVKVRRAYFNKSAMKTKYLELKLISPMDKLTEVSLRAALVQHYKDNPNDGEISVPTKHSRSAARQGFTLIEQMQYHMLQSAYMNPLQGKGKKNADVGTLLEPVIILNFIEDFNDGMVKGEHVIGAVNCPMVGEYDYIRKTHAQEDFMFFAFKGSADNLIYTEIKINETESRFRLQGVEIKARVTTKSVNAERANLKVAIQKYQERQLEKGRRGTRNDSRKKFYQLNWNDELIFDFIKDKKEYCQMLHLSTLYRLPYWTLVIGDKDGDIITAIRVRFNQEVHDTWRQCILLCSQHVFRAFFDGDFNKLASVISEVEVNKAALDERSLKHDWFLYLDVVTYNIMPLPPIFRILPLADAFWNIVKPGSDTISKIAASGYFHPPTQELPGKLIACSLVQVFVQLYRLFQIASPKYEMEEYKSLQNWRNAANHRYSYKDALLRIKKDYASTDNNNAMFLTPQEDNDAAVVFTNHTVPNTRSTQSVIVIKTGKVTGRTPSREALKTYQNIRAINKNDRTQVQQMLLDRRHHCKGNLVRIDGEATQGMIEKLKAENKFDKTSIIREKGSCIVCQNYNCRHYCTKCNHYFCIDKQCPLVDKGIVIRMKNDTLKKKKDNETEQQSYKDLYCVMDCYRFTHPNAFGDPDLFEGIEMKDSKSNRPTTATMTNTNDNK